MKIEVEKDEQYIYTETEYSNEFVKGARKLSGKWTGRRWKFDIRHEDRVRELLINVYGKDESDAEVECVTVKLDLYGYLEEINRNPKDIEMFGRVLACRLNRDSDVKLHNTVIISKGEFYSSGGSRNYPSLSPHEDLELEILDVPKSLYLKALNDEDIAPYISLVDGHEKQRQILLDEKESLLSRIKEIDKLLEEMQYIDNPKNKQGC